MKLKYRIRLVDGARYKHTLAVLHQQLFNHSIPSYIDPCFEAEWWLAERKKNEPVGFCAMIACHQYPDYALLVRSGVVPEHVGNGLQRRMIRTRVSRAKRQGYRGALVFINSKPHSIRNVLACGFEEWDPPIKYCEPGDEPTFYKLEF